MNSIRIFAETHQRDVDREELFKNSSIFMTFMTLPPSSLSCVRWWSYQRHARQSRTRARTSR